MASVLSEYVTFNGLVLEHHVADESAQFVFEQRFSVARYRTIFGAGLPLLVGLDFEWKPDRAAQNNPIALMQFACWDTVFLLRMSHCLELPSWLSDFLESGDEIVKITASFDIADKRKLQSSFNWDFDSRAIATSYWDIAELAAAREIPQGMLKMAHHFAIPLQKLKSVASSDWDIAGQKGLTAEQQEYAANDAFFQLYLFGRLLQIPPEPPKELLYAWNATSVKMEENMKRVDNSKYYNKFMALRHVLQDAVDILSKALGSGGCTTLNDLNQFKPVRAALKTATPVQVNANFLRQNSDIFVCFFRDGILRVRLRTTTPEDTTENATTLEDDVDFISHVQELLATYRPPDGKKKLSEPQWVPARAILARPQVERLEKSSRNSFVDTSYDSEDGMLLRLARHPRSADEVEHMNANVSKLCKDLDIDAAEAKQRLRSDNKFVQFWSVLQTVEAGSQEEQAISRSLSARSKILVDSHRLAKRLSTEESEMSWQQAKEGLEKVMWYRQLLGSYLADGGVRDDDFEECFMAIESAWPQVQNVRVKRKVKPERSGNSKRSRLEKRHAAQANS